MKVVLSQLNTLLSKYRDPKQRRQGYSDKVKELCVKLATMVGVKEASKQSGVGQVSIYKWIREGSHVQEQLAPSRDMPLLRPLVLQELKITDLTPTSIPREITLVSATGATVRMPADDKTLALVLDRMIGGRR